MNEDMMAEAVKRQSDRAEASTRIDRSGWSDDDWIVDADRLMNESDGAITSLVNGHVMALLRRLERMTNHIHDLTGDGTGWWTCNSCGYRTSSNLDQRNAELEAERDSARRRIQELMRFFRSDVSGRVWFNGHEFSIQHGLVELNEAGTHLVNWGDEDD